MCDAYSFLLYVALVTILYGRKYHCWLISDVLLQKCWVGIKFWLLGTFVVWCFYSVIHYLPWWVFCSFVRKQFLRHQPKMSHLRTFVLTVSVHLTYVGYYNFASAVVAVYSSHMTVSSSASWSTFSLPSNFVSVHVSTMWVVVCRWPQSQEGDWGNVWEQLVVWQPCELLYTCYLLLTYKVWVFLLFFTYSVWQLVLKTRNSLPCLWRTIVYRSMIRLCGSQTVCGMVFL